MLERAPSCLEQGGRRLLGTSRKSVRSHRSLHSAFWCHGAGQIDLPSWWLALLQQPPPENTIRRKGNVETASSCIATGSGETGFLDFLYPAKTLAIIHKLAIRDPTLLRHRHRHPLSSSSRSYASEAVAEHVNPTGGDVHAANLAQALRKIAANDNPDQKAEVLRRRCRLYSEECARLTNTDEFLSDLDVYQVTELLKSLEELEGVGSKLQHDFGDGILQRLGKIAPEEQWQPIHYAVGISVLVFQQNYDKAMVLYHGALERFQDHLASPMIIKLAIEQKAWQLAVDAWYAYNETVQAESYLWSGLADIDCAQLFRSITELAEVSKQSSHNADIYLRKFALAAIEQTLSIRHFKDMNVTPYEHYQLFTRLRALVTYPSEKEYSLAIRQCLGPVLEDSSPKARDFGNNAVRIYMAMRERDDITPGQELLEQLTECACVVHNVDTKLIFADLKKHFGVPSLRIYKLVIREAIHHNNADRAYELIKEAERHHENVMSMKLADRLIRMHAQRREVDQATKIFASIRQRTGERANDHHFNAMVLVHTRCGDIAGAKEWIQLMRQREVDVTFHTYIPLLRLFARRGDIDAVDNLIDEMRSFGIADKVDILECLIMAHIQNEDLDEAQDLLLESRGLSFEGDHTNMWNQVLTAFSTRRNIEEVNALREHMQDAGVVANEMTYAALASALCARKQPVSAFRLIRNTMRKANLRPSSLHCSIVMGGFIRTKQYDQVFMVYKWMIKHAVTPDLGAKTLLVKAAAMIDQEDGKSAAEAGEGVVLTRAEEILDQLLGSASSEEVRRNTPMKGVRWDSPDETFVSNYFDFLIFIYGYNRMHAKVDELFSKYLTHLRRNKPSGNAEAITPMRMLVALMIHHRQANNHMEVERLWNYAVETYQSVVQSDARYHSKKNVLPSRKFFLSRPLIHYMRSLADNGRSSEYDQLFTYLLAVGYGLDSKAWNLYVQESGLGDRHLHAFQTAEKQLMKTWRGWQGGHNPYTVMGKIQKQQPKTHEGTQRYPNYKTLVILARSFLNLQLKSAYDDEAFALLQKIKKEAPITADAIMTMPPLEEKLQQTLLRRG